MHPKHEIERLAQSGEALKMTSGLPAEQRLKRRLARRDGAVKLIALASLILSHLVQGD